MYDPQCLSIPATGQLNVDSYQKFLGIRRAFNKIHQDLPSVKLARLHEAFNYRTTHKGRVYVLLSVIQIKLSELDPDVTVEILKKSVLDLFGALDESVKSDIYTKV